MPLTINECVIALVNFLMAYKIADVSKQYFMKLSKKGKEIRDLITTP